MLALTKRTEYALIAVGYLAKAEPQVASAREIADRFRMRTPLLMGVLKQLTRNELVSSVRGVNGGYRLAVPSRSITLLDVVTAMEGPVRVVSCVEPAPNGSERCDLLETCPVRRPLARVQELLKQFLAGVSVAELASGGGDFAAMANESGLTVLVK